MKRIAHTHIYILVVASLLCLALAGCGEPRQTRTVEQPVPLDKPIGTVARMVQFEAVPVKGYGLVAGLAGTGSAECPPNIRDGLRKYIWQQMPQKVPINADELINSLDTAVVEITGTIPSLAMKGDRFDVKVKALPRTQTTSLAGGRLYTADLFDNRRGLQGLQIYQKTVAQAEGAVFIDAVTQDDPVPTEGHVLGGGIVGQDVKIALMLYSPNYYTASSIRNQLNQRFGPQTAKAISPGEVQIIIPRKYYREKERFLAMVQMSFLADSTQSQDQQVDRLVAQLANDPNKIRAEIALEAIGRPALYSLAQILKSDDPEVQFHAARCMLNIGDDQSLSVLRRISQDAQSPYRMRAIEAIGYNAKRQDAIAALTPLLGNPDLDVRLTAHRHLRRLEAASVSTWTVGSDIAVDSVIGGGKKVIYLSREGGQRIILFGAPIPLAENIFLQSPSRNVLVNARPQDAKVSLLRRHPGFPRPVGPLEVDRDVSRLIQGLGGRLPTDDMPLGKAGLGVCYSEIAAILEAMCEAGIIDAEFQVGPMTEVGSPQEAAKR